MSERNEEENVPRFLDRRSAADFIGLSDFWLAKHKSNPDAPPYIVYGRKCWYRRADLEAWVEERRRQAADPDASMQDIWEQSAERRSAAPREEDLSATFDREHGSEVRAVTLSKAMDRVRKLPPSSLKILLNTLSVLESSHA